MVDAEEKRAFGIHKAHAVMPYIKKAPKDKSRGVLYYYGEFIKEGTFPLLEVEKKQLISQGYNPKGFHKHYK